MFSPHILRWERHNSITCGYKRFSAFHQFLFLASRCQDLRERRGRAVAPQAWQQLLRFPGDCGTTGRSSLCPGHCWQQEALGTQSSKMKAPSFILNFFELIPYNLIFSPPKSIRNNQNSCYPRLCQWILRVCRNPTATASRVENPSMTLSAHLILFLLCVLDKERGVHFLRKKTRCVYKCCHWQGCCYSDLPALTGSLGNRNASFPPDSSTHWRSELKLAHFGIATALNSTVTKLSCWKWLSNFTWFCWFF